MGQRSHQTQLLSDGREDEGGEEHGERDLAQFDGLERERAEANPQAGSVGVASDHRQERHEQQPDADEAEDVAVALQGRSSAHDTRVST